MTDSMKLILGDICCGMRDAVLGALFIFRVDAEINTLAEERKRKREEKMRESQRRPIPIKDKKESEPKVMHRMLQCCLLNGGIFWLSIVTFNNLLLPLLQYITHKIIGISGQSMSNSTVWAWMGPMMSYTFGALWVLPLFVLSKAVSSLWFQDIADAAYRKSRGRPQLPNLSELIADMLFSLLIQALFLIQSMVVSLVPIAGVGQFLSLMHLCLLYSLYSFEYKWFNMGWRVHRRLAQIEFNWPYFFGFGLPLALLTSLPSSYIIRGCLFSILFPLFIISGNEAATPTQPCDFPLHVFSLVVEIANKMFHRTVQRPSKSR
ncbi:etoposide-induced protein 2.4-like [Patiria miniata]|uniref:Etoposide-induced protein 2.4 homolog n=1 Tax=Patiria miniata TaxID=46514 RepID=A0A914A3W9_PATMI|nr:etoposide-induced protein 2.4-like [Patiria miniata]XP_038058265.1 etoposide-induced protein 2.4-like [Patiria miniata]